MVLVCYTLRLVKKNSRHFLSQSEGKQKPIVTCSHTFSRAPRRLHVFVFWLVYWIVCVLCDWPEWLFWSFCNLPWYDLCTACKLKFLPFQKANYGRLNVHLGSGNHLDDSRRSILEIKWDASQGWHHATAMGKLECFLQSLCYFYSFLGDNNTCGTKMIDNFSNTSSYLHLRSIFHWLSKLSSPIR